VLSVVLAILTLVGPGPSAGAVTTSGVGNVVAGGAGYGCALRADGQVACWGQIGSVDSPTPVVYPGLSGVRQIAAASGTVCAVVSNNRVWCFGDNSLGQLGIGTMAASSNTPVQTTALVDAVRITGGANHFCVVRVNAAVRCWGANSSGEIGNNSTSTAVRQPVNVSGLTQVAQVSAGASHTCARKTSGQVVCWGANDHGQLGIGTTSAYVLTPQALTSMTNATALASGSATTCALTTTTGPQCWGSGAQGALGNGGTADSSTPVPVSGGLSGLTSIGASATGACVATSGGAVSCWGTPSGDGSGDAALTPVTVPGISDAAHLSAGALSTAPCVIRTGGQGACWGATPAVGDGSGTAQAGPVVLPGGAAYYGGPVDPVAPGAPEMLPISYDGSTVDLSWRAPVDDGRSPITSYLVTFYRNGTEQRTETVLAPNRDLPFTVRALTPSSTYTFDVRATNAVGTGPASALTDPITTPDQTYPADAPTGVTASLPTPGTLEVSWTPPGNDGGSAVSAYEVTTYRDGATAGVRTVRRQFADDPLPTTTTFTGLVQTSSYTFTVRAGNANGYGAASSPSDAVTPCWCITGRTVDDATSAGLAGVRVRALDATTGKLSAETTTDSTGAYVLFLPSATASYRIQFADKANDPATFPLQYHKVGGVERAETSRTFGLVDRIVVQRRITGTVLDQNDTPLVGVRVRAIDASTGKLGAEATTDATGAYSLKVPSPTAGYKIQFADKTVVPARFPIQYRMAGSSVAVVTAGGAPLVDRITVRGAITGVARDGGTDDVVAGLRVRALKDGKLVDETTTAADGTFTLDGLSLGTD
jgi:hypothetical protein